MALLTWGLAWHVFLKVEVDALSLAAFYFAEDIDSGTVIIPLFVDFFPLVDICLFAKWCFLLTFTPLFWPHIVFLSAHPSNQFAFPVGSLPLFIRHCEMTFVLLEAFSGAAVPRFGSATTVLCRLFFIDDPPFVCCPPFSQLITTCAL